MVTNFNIHREEYFIPSEWICVDKSISRWYRLGGAWINIGLLMYKSIDQKLENGCEIQNVACSKSGVMIRLLVFKNTKDSDLYPHKNSEEFSYGASIINYLVLH